MDTADAGSLDGTASEAAVTIIVAAEAREFAGLADATRWQHPHIAYVARWRDCLLLANGPGPSLVRAALSHFKHASVLMSVGFCGALDSRLRVGDIVVAGEMPRRASLPFASAEILSVDRVAWTAGEKRRLREQTGAAVVEMESAAVAAQAAEWGVPYRAVKVVSDTADESLPLDFTAYSGRDGRFQLARIALAGLLRPFTVLPELMRLDRQSKLAAQKLGAFLADCEY
jgi:hypothetical protein